MILVIGGIKGGIGKTTIANNLAVMRALDGYDVLLVDADEQQSAKAFHEWREEATGDVGYSFLQLTGKPLRSQLPRYAEKYQDVIIDVGGRDTASQRAALLVADQLIVPFPPKSLDVETLAQVEALVEEARLYNELLKAACFLNMGYPQGRDNEEAAAFLSESEELTFLNAPIINRKAFSDATAVGRSVTEYSPKDRKAIREITILYEMIFGGHFGGKMGTTPEMTHGST